MFRIIRLHFAAREICQPSEFAAAVFSGIEAVETVVRFDEFVGEIEGCGWRSKWPRCCAQNQDRKVNYKSDKIVRGLYVQENLCPSSYQGTLFLSLY